MKLICRVALVGCLIGSLAASARPQDQDKEGSKDHPLITRYKGSFIQNYAQREFDE